MRSAGGYLIGRQVALAVLLSVLVGCGGMEYGGEVRVPASQRHVLTAGAAAGDALSLPGDRGYNIHVKQSSQDPGARGTARGESDANRAGTASCQVEATAGGAATAEFKVGHRIDNRSEQTQLAAVTIGFGLDQTVETSDRPQGHTLAKAELHLIIIDSRKRVVSRTTIIQTDSDQAVGATKGPQQRLVKARLEPGESYDFVVFGRVEAITEGETQNGQKAAASIKVDQLRMDLDFSELTTQPAAG